MNTWSKPAKIIAFSALLFLLYSHAAQAQLPVPVFGQRGQPCQVDLSRSSNLGPVPLYGSDVVAAAMVLRYFGVATDPRDLTSWLQANNGFSNGEVAWSVAAGRGSRSGVTLGGSADWPNVSADLGTIDRALSSGYPVIAETRLPYNGTQKHYVMITGVAPGASGPIYFINDPWFGDVTTFNERYRDPLRYIYSARVFQGSPITPQGISLNGFLPGEATWWSDWEAAWAGWKPLFAANAEPRQPWRWWDLVQNAERLNEPRVGALMVLHNALNGGVEGGEGHIAYVIGVQGNRWRVRHSNWKGSRWPTEAEFELASSDTVRLVEGKPTDPPIKLRGFLWAAGQSFSTPPVPPPCGKRVLIISSDRDHESVLQVANIPGDRLKELPVSLGGYAVIWFADLAAIRQGTGELLARFVEEGGGLVTSGGIAWELAEVHHRSSRAWMGIRNLGFVDRLFPNSGIVFPPKLLGRDLRPDTVWMRPGGGNIVTVDMNYASGQAHVGHPGSGNRAVCYTYLHGKGRFFFLSSVADLENQPVIQKALCAGIEWVQGD